MYRKIKDIIDESLIWGRILRPLTHAHSVGGDKSELFL